LHKNFNYLCTEEIWRIHERGRKSPLSLPENIGMIKEEFIRNLSEQHLGATDKFIVSIKVTAGNNIRIFIDADNGVAISDCAQLSRFIESNLNLSNEIFDLEVSSAGLDSPLVQPRQYKKNIGREVKVKLKSGAEIKGTLTGISENGFEITTVTTEKINKKKVLTTAILLPAFDEVKETKLVF
jgi:ribosome maturation factor RimP